MADEAKQGIPPFAASAESESKSEAQMVREIYGLYDECARAWQKERASYKAYYRWWAGDHWKDVQKAEWQSKAAPNYIFGSIETIVPILADGMPRWTAEAKGADDDRMASIAKGILNEIWDWNRMSAELSKHVRSVLKYGTAYWQAIWDDDARGGMGDIVVRHVDPHNILVDPSALSFEDANYVLHVDNVSTGYVKRVWGKKVKPGVLDKFLVRDRDPLYGSEEEASPQTYLAPAFQGRVELTPSSAADSGYSDYSVSKQVTLIEAWIRDPDTGVIKVWYIAGDECLECFENPLGDVFPFSRSRNYDKDGAWHGMSEIENIVNPQQIVNAFLAQLIDNLRVTGNPPLIYSNQTGFRPDKMAFMPGIAIGVNGDPNLIKWLQSPVLDPKMFALVDFMRSAIDTVTGVHDVTQGKRPTGVTAASAIAELQEAAQTKIREKFRQLAYGLEDIGDIVWGYVKLYYDRPRILRMTDLRGDIRYVMINQSVVDADGKILKMNNPQEGEFNIRIDLGAGLPASKVQKANLALQAFQLGLIDQQAALEGLDYHGREEIAARMKEAQAQAAQAQAAQAGAAAGAAPGGSPPPPPEPGEVAAADEDMMNMEGAAGQGAPALYGQPLEGI